MIVKNLDVLEIKAVKVDSRAKKATLKISFANETPLMMEITLDEVNPDLLLDRLLKKIKQEKRPTDNDQDDILCGIAIVNIANDEDVREKAVKGFFHLEKKVENFTKIRHAADYMKAYGQMLTLEEVIYKKGN